MFRLDLQFEILHTDPGNNCWKTLTGYFKKKVIDQLTMWFNSEDQSVFPPNPLRIFFLISFGIYSLVNPIQRLTFSVELTFLIFQNFNPSRRKENSQSWTFFAQFKSVKNVQCAGVR